MLERTGVREKVSVVENFDGCTEAPFPPPDLAEYAVLTGKYQANDVRPKRGNRPADFISESLCVGGFVEWDVAHADLLALQMQGKVTHCRQEQCRSLSVARDVGRFFPNLHHQHRITPRVEVAKCGRVAIELIAKHHYQALDISRNCCGG